MELRGCGTALVTPFTADGAVDERALRAHVAWQVECGVRLLIPCGTTGEASTLTDAEWLRVIALTVEEAAGRALVFAGCTHNATAQTVARARELTALRVPTAAGERGVDGILVANPYYNKPGQEGQYQHFRAVADAVADPEPGVSIRPAAGASPQAAHTNTSTRGTSTFAITRNVAHANGNLASNSKSAEYGAHSGAAGLPVMLYNIPGRTAANLEPATAVRLAHDCPNIVAIKESSGNLLQITELLTTAPASLRVFAGDDGLALPIVALGGAGLISVASNVIPREMVRLIDAACSNDWPAARALNAEWFRLLQAHFWEASPAPVKAVLQMLGRGDDHLRLPMVPVTDATRARLRTLVEELQLATTTPAN
jgi:dihydrodipicolinate synthase/N-acetylneuraminate lyase